MIGVMVVVFFGLLALSVPVGHVLVIASGAAIWSKQLAAADAVGSSKCTSRRSRSR